MFNELFVSCGIHYLHLKPAYFFHLLQALENPEFIITDFLYFITQVNAILCGLKIQRVP